MSDLTDLANSRVRITAVLADLGVDSYDGGGYSSMKLHCPFEQLSHLDGGDAKSLRVYTESNTAYCFACGKYYSPVRFYAEAHDVSDEDAAHALLESTGYVPENLDSRWEKALEENYAIDRESLAEALKIFCGRVDPDWEVRQFDTEVLLTFRECVDLLVHVVTPEASKKWLSASKRIMATRLGVNHETVRTN